MNDVRNTFQKQGYVLIKNFIPKDTAQYLFEYLKFSVISQQITGNEYSLKGDPQVPGSFTRGHGDLALDALMKMMKPKMEEITGLLLFPTYTYSRIYKTGNYLAHHKDRESCEISVTIKLSCNDNSYNWPIWMNGEEYRLDDGDGIVYRGCDLDHWREVCEAPVKWRMGQVFMHYVDANGINAEFKYDKRLAKTKLFEGEI